MILNHKKNENEIKKNHSVLIQSRGLVFGMANESKEKIYFDSRLESISNMEKNIAYINNLS